MHHTAPTGWARSWLALLAAGALAMAQPTTVPKVEPEVGQPDRVPSTSRAEPDGFSTTGEARQRPASVLARRRALELEEQAIALIDRDPAAAERLLLEQLTLDPEGSVVRYNLACARSMQGDAAGAMDRLVEAVERGFVDLPLLKRDRHLETARQDPRFARMVASWPEVLDRHARWNLARTRELFAGEAYAHSRNDRLRIDVLSAMDPGSTEEAKRELERLHEWGLRHVFTDLNDAEASRLDAWCVVVLPISRDFVRWTFLTYGQGLASPIGGAYQHDQKRLVAQDLGSTLRHEYFHVLHWRSVTRLGQDHPIWIQEGLCSLVEDMEQGADGSAAAMRPVASWRTNISRRLASSGGLMRISDLARLPRERFTGHRPLAHYAQARTVFLFLWERGALGTWYSHYAANHAVDPSGVASIEAVLGKPIAEIEREYRAWVLRLPEVAEPFRPGRASLGVDVDPGAGDGPVIASLPRLDRRTPNPARAAGLRERDVIVSIDGTPTRDLNELLRVLGERRVGEEVEVGYRRGTQRGTVRVKLVPRTE